jgi:type I restriction enzyme S subunit
LLDAKIELNNQINSELEAMAKLIYDYWFLQFDFPDENGEPYKSSGGNMVYNEELKREIPDGWEVTQLSKIANITMGQSPNGSSYNIDKEGTVFFQGSSDFGGRFPKAREYTTEPSRFAKSGDILMSVRAPVGTLNVADVDCCIGRGLAALSSKDVAFFFLFNVMTNYKKVFDRRSASGTTFGAITKPDLYSLKVVRPPSDILNLFNAATSDFQNSIHTNHRQNLEFTELRDWLLPMLMIGQVTISEARKQSKAPSFQSNL